MPLLPTCLDQRDELELMYGRVHEFCGRARHRLALWVAAQTRGEILWIAPKWAVARLNPCGIMPVLSPARLILVEPDRAEDVLWSMEEALRSGAVASVIADLPAPPGLTPVRRMHLAAETGGQKRACPPIGLLLTPDQGGAQGVESRWRLEPAHAANTESWNLHRLRARMAPEKSWKICQDAENTSLRTSPL